jgi:hypothetical protein
MLNPLKKAKIISENDRRETTEIILDKKGKNYKIIRIQNPRYIILEIKYLLKKKKKKTEKYYSSSKP